MQSPSGTLRIAAAVGLTLAGIIIFRALESPAAKPVAQDLDTLVLMIHTKDGEFHELASDDCPTENKFIDLLSNTSNYSKKHTLKFKHKDAKIADCTLPGPCAKCSPNAEQSNIKTDKVTIASAAQSAPDGDPHVTTQVASTKPTDIKAVLDMLKE